MLGFKVTTILLITVLAVVTGSVTLVKNMTASRAEANVQTSPAPTASSSPSIFPLPTVTGISGPSPSVIPSLAPSIKPSASPSAKPSPTPVATPTVITTTTTTVTTQNNSPKLESLDPSNPAFSAPMTIKGSGFGTQAGIINIFNYKGEAQPYPNSTSWSDTEIKTYSPFYASDQEYQVEIQTADGRRSNRLIVRSGGGQPQLDSISPSNAKPGEELVFKGSRYDSNPGKVEFFFNYPNISGTGETVSWSDNEIRIKIPANLEPGKEYGIQVTNGRGGQSSFKYYTLGS